MIFGSEGCFKKDQKFVSRFGERRSFQSFVSRVGEWRSFSIVCQSLRVGWGGSEGNGVVPRALSKKVQGRTA